MHFKESPPSINDIFALVSLLKKMSIAPFFQLGSQFGNLITPGGKKRFTLFSFKVIIVSKSNHRPLNGFRNVTQNTIYPTNATGNSRVLIVLQYSGGLRERAFE